MKSLIHKNLLFFILCLLFLITGAYLLLNYSKDDVFLAINNYQSAQPQALGMFFQTITHLGSGVFYVGFIICLLFVRYRYAIMGAISFSLLSLIVQTMKHLVFSDALRPVKYFEGIETIHTVSGMQMHSYNSFPSGHAAVAFGLFCLLALISSNKALGAAYFFIALLIAFSRVYLAQHFFNDIYFGSMIGVFATVVSYIYVNGSTKLNNKSWIDKSLKIIKPKELNNRTI